jgi:hypothetical protein
MAAKLRLITVLLLLVVGAALTVILLLSQSEKPEFSRDDLKFIDVYVRLSVAGESPVTGPGSRNLTRDSILAENGVDSLWMARYTRNLSGDTHRQLSIWQEIAGRLDSLQKTHPAKRRRILNPPPP